MSSSIYDSMIKRRELLYRIFFMKCRVILKILNILLDLSYLPSLFFSIGGKNSFSPEKKIVINVIKMQV